MNIDDGGNLIIEEYVGDGTDWNAFALSHPEAMFCHLWQYGRVIEESYGYKPKYFIVRKSGETMALLPASIAKSLLFGKKLVSQPFSEYGGILASDLRDAEYLNLIDYLIGFCARNGVPAIELHANQGVPENARKSHFIHTNPYMLAILKLGPDFELIRNNVFDYSVRKAINKAERTGVKAFEDSSPEIIRERFWPLFLGSMKRLGVPPHPLSYFLSLKRHYPDEMKIFWAELEGKLIAALLGFAVGNRIQIINIVSDEESWEHRPNDMVHWEFIKWGCVNGYTEFDFGSVRYEGQLKYKKKWGAEFKESGYYFIQAGDEKVKTFSSSSGIMDKFSKAWSRYVPLYVTPFLGQIIRKHLIR